MLSNNATLPLRATSESAGLDLFSAMFCVIPSGERRLISTDISIKVPHGCYARLASRSGLAYFDKIDVGAGTIDSDYTGNIKVLMINNSSIPFVINIKDRICQLICQQIFLPKIKQVDNLPLTFRGNQGFGSSGK